MRRPGRPETNAALSTRLPEKIPTPYHTPGIVYSIFVTYIESMKSTVLHALILMLVFTSVLASPAVMAWTMPAENASSDCSLCQADTTKPQHSTAATSTCAVAICGIMADVAHNTAGVTPLPPAVPTFHIETHLGRQLEGPDPFPPRAFHV